MPDTLMSGPRIYLRALNERDADVMAEDMNIDEETFFRRGRIPQSASAFRAWIAGLPTTVPPDEVNFAVCLREDDHLIGTVGLEHIDWVNRVAESGSHIFQPQHRGHGYGTEAKHLLLEYAFERIQLHAIRSFVFETNTRSAAALLKQGYRPAGKLVRQNIKNRTYRGFLIFDCLREDWREAHAHWLENAPQISK